MSASRPSLRHGFLSACILVILAALQSASGADSPLAGRWELDRSRSDDPNSWSSLFLQIEVAGERVTLQRRFQAMSRRQFIEQMELDLTQPESIVPVEFWPDNRYIGANIGGDRQKRVRARWLDDRRILRLDTTLTLSTQQGDRPVNILSDYKVSANGELLTLVELRSTRNEPIVYTFKRATR